MAPPPKTYWISIDIIYLNDKFKFNPFTIQGCPKPGYFGEDCSLFCPENCQEGHCNIINGACLGCVNGYKGQNCKESEFCSLLWCTKWVLQ